MCSGILKMVCLLVVAYVVDKREVVESVRGLRCLVNWRMCLYTSAVTVAGSGFCVSGWENPEFEGKEKTTGLYIRHVFWSPQSEAMRH